jgi:hypothetical protein
MRTRNLFGRISVLLLVVLCLVQSAFSARFEVNNLYRVKKIYLASVINIEEEKTALKNELEKQGFEMVDAPAKADAILSRKIQASFALDDEGLSVPDKAIYSYWLSLPNNEVIWKSKVTFISKSNMIEDMEYAAKKIAEKLAKDWQKSAKKAGAK